ncbi:MAG: hypothetical protein U0R50_15060 [Gaiellales bacterium]
MVVPAVARRRLTVAALAIALALSAFGGEGRAAANPAATANHTAAEVTRTALHLRKVASWLSRYPSKPITAATYDQDRHRWTVRAWSGKAGEIARVVVDDRTGVVAEAWTGPQVAWRMARGRPGAFGGRTLTSWPMWLTLSAVFFLGLADLRRPLSVRNADLLALLSFGIPLAFFNRGEIFESVLLTLPPLVYVLCRSTYVGFRSRPPRSSRPVVPAWLLLAATLFLVGMRIGLNVQTERSVIDVGYAGVIGASRILDGQAPYGHMPQEGSLPKCGPADSDGRVRNRIQANGRCEGSNAHGDTYGPIAYLAYVPAVAAFGWSGRWDGLPAAHATAIALDLAVLAGLALLGLRLGGRRLAAALAFAWVANPFTAYVLLSNTNDALMPAALVWGLVGATSASARGVAVALAGWAKFAALLLVPLWLGYAGRRRGAHPARFAVGFAVATAAAFSILLFEPDLGEALRTFWQRTFEFQLERDSPFSIWGWGQYHAEGIPDLALGKWVVEAGTLALAGIVAVFPARKGPLELAALTAALLIATQLCLTHWFYLYIPWFLPFVVLAIVWRDATVRVDP